MSKDTSKAVATQEQQAEPDLERQLLGEAKTPQERAMAFSLAGVARQQTMLRLTAMKVAETGWGKDVSPIARQAVVRYCMEIGADPVGHVYILGGNIYLNAAFWMELVAANPKFVRSSTTYIHDDDRADQIERDRRKVQRLLYAVPENVKGAAVVTLFYDGRGPFIGVNWAGTGKKTASGKFEDPVGEDEPTKTAETRAYRRAARKAEPAWFGQHPRLKATQELFVQGVQLEPSGAEEDETPVGALGEGEQTRVGVIERHEPSAICDKVGEHKRDDCGYHRAKKEPPAS